MTAAPFPAPAAGPWPCGRGVCLAPHCGEGCGYPEYSPVGRFDGPFLPVAPLLYGYRSWDILPPITPQAPPIHVLNVLAGGR